MPTDATSAVLDRLEAAGHTDHQLRDFAVFLATHRHTIEQHPDARPPAAATGQ